MAAAVSGVTSSRAISAPNQSMRLHEDICFSLHPRRRETKVSLCAFRLGSVAELMMTEPFSQKGTSRIRRYMVTPDKDYGLVVRDTSRILSKQRKPRGAFEIVMRDDPEEGKSTDPQSVRHPPGRCFGQHSRCAGHRREERLQIGAEWGNAGNI